MAQARKLLPLPVGPRIRTLLCSCSQRSPQPAQEIGSQFSTRIEGTSRMNEKSAQEVSRVRSLETNSTAFMAHLRQSVIKRPRYWFSNPRNENSFVGTCANFIGGRWSVAAVKWADAVIDARAHPSDRSGPAV